MHQITLERNFPKAIALATQAWAAPVEPDSDVRCKIACSAMAIALVLMQFPPRCAGRTDGNGPNSSQAGDNAARAPPDGLRYGREGRRIVAAALVQRTLHLS